MAAFNSLKSLFSNGPAMGITLAGALLLKNDQRDYTETAMTIAPIAYGGTYLFGRIGKQTAATAKTMFQAVAPSSNPVQTALRQNMNFNQMKAVFRDRGASNNSVAAAINSFMANKKMRGKSLEQELASLHKLVHGNFLYDDSMKELVEDFINNPGKSIPPISKEVSKEAVSKMRHAKRIADNFQYRKQLTSNAFVGAMFDSASPADIITNRAARLSTPSGKSSRGTSINQFSGVLNPNYINELQDLSGSGRLEDLPAPKLNEVLGKIYTNLSDRPNFVSSLKSSLTRAKHSIDPSNSARSFEEVFNSDNPNILPAGATVEHSLGSFSNLEHQIPEFEQTARNLFKAKADGRIREAFVISQKVADGQVVGGREIPLGISVEYGAHFSDPNPKKMFLPFKRANGASPSVSRNSYVVRDVFDNNGNTRPLHSFASELLADRHSISIKSIAQEVSGIAHWNGLEGSLNAREFGSEEYDLLNSARSSRIRNHDAVFSNLPIYTDPYGKTDDFRSFSALNPSARTAKMAAQITNKKYLPLGSEKGLTVGTLQDAVMERLHPWTLAAMTKQDTIYSAVSKNISLMTNDRSNQFFTNENYDPLTGSSNIPEIGAHIASVAPQDKALFANLPKTLKEFDKNNDAIRQRFGLDPEQWDGLNREIRSQYHETGGNEPMSAFGQLGETEYLMSPEFTNKSMVGFSKGYDIDTINANVGDSVMAGQILGWKDYQPVKSLAEGLITADLSADSNGSKGFKLVVEHGLSMHGGKISANGVKGLAFKNPHVNRMRLLLNALTKARGGTDIIPEGIDAIADMSYYANKAEVAHTSKAMLGDVLRNAFSGEDEDVFDGLTQVTRQADSALSGWGRPDDPRSIFEHFNFNHNILSLKSDQLNHADRAVKARQVKEIYDMSQEVIENANRRIREKKAEGYTFKNKLFRNFAESGSDDLSSWMRKNYAPSMVRATDHMSLFASGNASMTFDMESFASLRGNYAAVKTLAERKVMYGGGSLDTAVKFGNHLVDPENNPLTGPIVSRKDAFPSIEKSLATPEGRAGSIFDTSNPIYQDNFTMDLGEGGKYKTIPVLGNGAYSGTSPNYTQENQQVRDYQRKVQEIADTPQANVRDRLVEELNDTYHSDLLTGKGGILRPRSFDPKGVTGFLRTKTTDNLFDSFIGPDVLDTIKDSKMKDHLRKGGHTYGMMWRQPVSTALHVRVKYDPKLTGGRGIAANEEFYRLMQADADKDPVSISLWDRSSEAYKEAEEAINSGRQHKAVETFYEHYSRKDDSMHSTAELTPMDDSFNKYYKTASDIGPTVANRGAGASIGPFSNQLSAIVESAAADVSITRDRELADRLEPMLFAIRQTPINAPKSHVNYTLEQALADHSNLAKAWSNNDETTATDEFQKTLAKLAQVGKKPDEPNLMFDKIMSDQGRSDITTLMRSRTDVSKLRARLLVGSNNPDRVKRMLEGVKEAGGFENVAGASHGYASAEAAAAQGSINAEIRAAAKATKESFKDAGRAFARDHGRAALIGTAAIAALGLMSSSNNRKSLTMSSNNYRPEETAGVHDRLPGAPIIGSGSSAPPRTYTQSQTGVSHAIVAPINNAVNTNVSFRAKDNAASVEMSKAMGKLGSKGHQHVNVNYSTDPRIGTLRFRDHVRNMREN